MPKENSVTIIKNLKAEVFDIIREQEALNHQSNQLQEIKAKKLQQLLKLEKEIKDKNTKNRKKEN